MKSFSTPKPRESDGDYFESRVRAVEARHRLRVLMISNLFPGRTSRNPQQGVFVVEQLREYRTYADFYLAVPVDVTPSLGLLKSQRNLSGCLRELSNHFQRTLFTHLDAIRDPVPGEYVRFVSIPPKSLLPFTVGVGQFLSIAPRLRKLGPFDLVHARSVLLGGLGGVLTAKWLGVPSVITAIGSDLHSIKNRAELKTARFVLGKADLITCVSSELRARAEDLGAAPDKIKVIGNGVNLDFRTGRENVDVRARHCIPPEAPLVLFVGHLEDVKDPLNLIRAFRSVYEATNAHLIIVGGGVLEDRVREEIIRGKMDRVHLAGRIPHVDVASYMAACSVFCLPSVREGWSNVLLEAMLFGKPVVATCVGGIPEVVCDPSFGILTEPQNADAFGQALLSALGRSWDHGKITAHAEANTWAKAAECYVGAYREAIRRSAGKP